MTALQDRSGSGGCLCGAVRYSIRGPLRATAVACHCTTCRRFTGGLWVGTCARRAAGSLDVPTGLRLAVHSWTAESADYWSFDPGIPRKPGPSGLRGPEG